MVCAIQVLETNAAADSGEQEYPRYLQIRFAGGEEMDKPYFTVQIANAPGSAFAPPLGTLDELKRNMAFPPHVVDAELFAALEHTMAAERTDWNCDSERKKAGRPGAIFEISSRSFDRSISSFCYFTIGPESVHLFAQTGRTVRASGRSARLLDSLNEILYRLSGTMVNPTEPLRD